MRSLGPLGRDLRAGVAQPARPDLRVATLVDPIGGTPPRGGDPSRCRPAVVEHDRVALQPEVGEAPSRVSGVSGLRTGSRADASRRGIRGGPCRASRASAAAPYTPADDGRRATAAPVPVRGGRRARRCRRRGAPRAGRRSDDRARHRTPSCRPRSGSIRGRTSSFAHAMPAFVRGARDGRQRRPAGLKWVTGFPDNRGARACPPIHATVAAERPATGAVRARARRRPITRPPDGGRQWRRDRAMAARRAAAGPASVSLARGTHRRRRPGRSSPARVGHLLPDRPGDRRPACRAGERLAGEARRPAFSSSCEPSWYGEAMEGRRRGAVTVVSFGPGPAGDPGGCIRDRATVVAVDYDMCVPASVARGAGTVRGRRARPVPGQPRDRDLRGLSGSGPRHRRGAAREQGRAAVGAAPREAPARRRS